MNNPVKKAINIVGSQTELARLCDVWQQTVSKWLYKGYVPFESVDKVIIATGGKITAIELCPKIKKIITLHEKVSITTKP
jgi:DNA-binding transcriptional regulator YdaS (Cro superfamily)